MYRTEAQARKKARGVGIGDYIAELIIPRESEIAVERTLRSSGHHTLWGDPGAILACVRRVVAVSEDD